MEKTRLERFYTLSCMLYILVTTIYGFSVFLSVLRNDNELENELIVFLFFAYIVVISPFFCFHELSLHRLQCAGLRLKSRHRILVFAHGFWRVVMWVLMFIPSLLMFVWIFSDVI